MTIIHYPEFPSTSAFLDTEETFEIRLFNKLALEHFETNGNKKTFKYESMQLRGANMSM